MNLCTICGKYLGSVQAFDAHVRREHPKPRQRPLRREHGLLVEQEHPGVWRLEGTPYTVRSSDAGYDIYFDTIEGPAWPLGVKQGHGTLAAAAEALHKLAG